MKLQEILVATDETEASAQALRTALEVARRSAGRVTAMRVLSAPAIAPVAVAVKGTGVLAVEEEMQPASSERMLRESTGSSEEPASCWRRYSAAIRARPSGRRMSFCQEIWSWSV